MFLFARFDRKKQPEEHEEFWLLNDIEDQLEAQAEAMRENEEYEEFRRSQKNNYPNDPYNY